MPDDSEITQWCAVECDGRCLHIESHSFSFYADICNLHPISVWITSGHTTQKMYANKHGWNQVRHLIYEYEITLGTISFNRLQEFKKKTKTTCGFFECHHPIKPLRRRLASPAISVDSTFAVDVAPTHPCVVSHSLFASKVFFDNCLCTWGSEWDQKK